MSLKAPRAAMNSRQAPSVAARTVIAAPARQPKRNPAEIVSTDAAGMEKTTTAT
jgi:hypothetical protein